MPTLPSDSGAAPAEPVHVIGATGRSGAALCRALLADGVAVVPVVRDRVKWSATRIPAAPRVADLGDAGALKAALADARRIACCAHARYANAVLNAAPEAARFAFLGSTRKFTRWPDAHGTGVIAGEVAFLTSQRSGVMLHPTMIYGAKGEDNVQRLATLVGRLPFVPLPGGGRSLVQPIHQDDVVRALRAALERDWNGPESIVIAGPEPLPYADFVRAVAAAAGLKQPRIIGVPAVLLLALAPLATRLPGLPTIRRAEIRRLMEDKAFDIGPLRARLGVTPMPLAQGLARTFAGPHNAGQAQAPAPGDTHADHQPHR